MALSGRVLNVMSQLPNHVVKQDNQHWQVLPMRGSSALYSSNKYLHDESQWETHHIGWTGEITSDAQDATGEGDPLYLDEADKETITQMIRKQNDNQNTHPVWLLRKDQNRFRKYAENVIWPVFHYMMMNEPNDFKEENQWWYDYVKFNEAYAMKIKQLAKPGDIIWIHDYYLLLLPQILRMELDFDVHICHFLHIPFPSSEYFRCLSKRKLLLDGMLGANQLGFQSGSFAKHFISCCSRVNGYETTANGVQVHSFQTNVVSLPLGIDVKNLEIGAFTKEVEDKIQVLKKLNKNRKIIIGRDRLDSVRGVVQKLQAFEIFLEMYPQWIGKVVLIQVSFKPFYHSSKLEKQVNELIFRINGRYGSLDYSPILHYNMRIPKVEYYALLRVADLCMITSVRDGMNTTALEYIVCQKDKCSPLIMSEFSGTCSFLKKCIQINPWDSVAVGNCINDCLNMAKPQSEALEKELYHDVEENTNQVWTMKVLKNLINFVQKSSANGGTGTPYLNKPLLLKKYQNSKKRLFLFDYDGTLTPIVRDPNSAIPSARLYDILEKLTEDPLNDVWIISGRDQAFLEKWIGSKYPHIGLSAEHGCFMKKINSSKWVNLTETLDMSWQSIVEEVFSKFTEKTPGSFIERKKVALTWHYRKADPDFGIFQANKCKEELTQALANHDVEVMSGKANLEVRPKLVNKGEIVYRLITYSDVVHLTPKKPEEKSDFVLCLGDDTTDEDMFRSMNEIEAQTGCGQGMFPVTVGPYNKETVAKAYLSDTQQVLDTLGLLLGDVSIFETAGTVDLDDRGHLKGSAAAEQSVLNREKYTKNMKSC